VHIITALVAGEVTYMVGRIYGPVIEALRGAQSDSVGLSSNFQDAVWSQVNVPRSGSWCTATKWIASTSRAGNSCALVASNAAWISSVLPSASP